MVLLTICGTLASEGALERIKAALKHAGPDIADQFVLALGCTVELGGPFEKSLVAVGHRREPQGSDVVLHPHRRLQDGVGAEHVVVREPEQLLADAIAVAQAKVAHASDLVRGLAALDAALRNRRMPVRQAVEIAHARPDAVVAGVDDGGDVDPGHGVISTFLARSAFGGGLAGGGGRRIGLAFRLALAALAGFRFLDALHVARLADQAGHLGKAAALDADIGEDRVDQWRLHPVTQRRVDHLVGGAAAAIVAAAPAVEAVDLKDADALDLLHRLDALAHDALDAVEQLAAEQRVARLICEHVLGFVEQPLRLGLDGGAHALGVGRDLRLLGPFLRQQHLDGFLALGDLAVAGGDDAFGGLGGPRARILGRHLGGGFLERLLIEGDGLFHQRRFDFLLAVDLQLAQVALAADAGFVEAAVGGDAGPFDLLAGGDLGFLQRLDPGDFELFDRATAGEPGGFERLFARDIRGLDFLARDDFRLLDLAIGIDAFGAFCGQRDHALLVGDLDRLLLVDVEHLAGLRRGDALGLQRQFDLDAAPLDRIAPFEFGGLDRFGAVDLQSPGFLLGPDTLGGDHLLLGNARRLDGFTRGDIGFLDRAVARDFERAHALFLGNTGGFGCLARGDACDFERLVAFDFELARRVFGADPLRRQHPLPRNPCGFHRLLRLDLGFLNGTNPRNLQRPGALVGSNAFDVDDRGLGDAGLFGRLAR